MAFAYCLWLWIQQFICILWQYADSAKMSKKKRFHLRAEDVFFSRHPAKNLLRFQASVHNKDDQKGNG